MRPERGVRGPERPTLRDIDALNRIFSEAFTDRYARDGLSGVRVPHLNPLVWRYAIEDAGDGAMIWRDADGGIAGFNMVHRSGAEGWMGPIAVRPDLQSEGLGTAMVRAGIEWLEGQGATTIGLETMPRTVENIGFYSRLGFVPGALTVTLVRDLSHAPDVSAARLSAGGLEQGLRDCRALTAALVPGVDFTRELALTQELALGDTALVRRDGALAGFVLWHSVGLAAGRPRDELRVLKIVAKDLDAFRELVDVVQGVAEEARVRRVSIRCQTAYAEAYLQLVSQGFRVHWTDLRMTLSDRPERRGAGVVMSNWEI
ncbi:MAG TPA: GNAT family N-acetyltransferase [Gemmatimonadales bacterium]|nr:GNAT family N-acetyltransferase [Gemmatimonadales bacterium]